MDPSVSKNTDNFTSLFTVGMPVISFFCLIALARTSNAMLNSSDEHGNPLPFS